MACCAQCAANEAAKQELSMETHYNGRPVRWGPAEESPNAWTLPSMARALRSSIPTVSVTFSGYHNPSLLGTYR